MLPRKHPRMSALIAGLVLAALPAQTQACWLFNCFGHQSRTTFLAPAVAAAPVCAPCAQQTVSYVPQTAYRPLVTTTPVTALRPVVATDPCTGCPTTVMQPTTTYVQRTVLMPYTTYRPVIQTSLFAPAVAAPVIAAPACPTGVCAPAASTTYYQPATVAPAMAQPACCAPTATTTFGPVSNATAAPSIGAPSYGPSGGASQKAFTNGGEPPADQKPSNNDKSNANGNADMTSFKPAPIPHARQNANGREPTAFPELRDPRNRTTSSPIPVRSYAVAWKAGNPANETAVLQQLDDSGWEAAR